MFESQGNVDLGDDGSPYGNPTPMVEPYRVLGSFQPPIPYLSVPSSPGVLGEGAIHPPSLGDSHRESFKSETDSTGRPLTMASSAGFAGLGAGGGGEGGGLNNENGDNRAGMGMAVLGEMGERPQAGPLPSKQGYDPRISMVTSTSSGPSQNLSLGSTGASTGSRSPGVENVNFDPLNINPIHNGTGNNAVGGPGIGTQLHPLRVVNNDHPDNVPTFNNEPSTPNSLRSRRIPLSGSGGDSPRGPTFRRHEDAGRVPVPPVQSPEDEVVDLPPLYEQVPRDVDQEVDQGR